MFPDQDQITKIRSIAPSERTTLIDIDKEPIIYSYFRGRFNQMVWETALGETFFS